MEHYTFDELFIGLEHEFTYTVTQEKQNMFKNLTKDNNPLHVDENYAKKRGFSGCVVYGMLSASLLSTLVGVFIPGEHALFQGLNIAFIKPVYINDTLKVHGVIKEMNESFKQIIIKVTITNQNGVKVLRGTATTGVI